MSKPSIAVAYSMKKKAKKASGGMVSSGDPTMNYSKGGSVEHKERRGYGGDREAGAKGVHRSSHSSGKDRGRSEVGDVVNSPRAYAISGITAKEEHGRVLGDLKSMKGPHGNYADGGEVVEQTPKSAGSAPPCTNCGHVAMSEGGEVANDTGEGQGADKSPNQFDDLVLRDGLEFSETGENSGDKKGDKRSHKEDDLVAKAMLKRKSKR